MWFYKRLIFIAAIGIVGLSALFVHAKRYTGRTHIFPGQVSFIGTINSDMSFEGDTINAYKYIFDFRDPTQNNTISWPDEDGRSAMSYLNANSDIDTAAASTKWTVSDTTNWTIDVGTSNSRTGGNSLEFKTDNTVDDELEFDNTSVVDLSDFKFIGFWMRNDGGILAATEFDADLRTPNDTVITNCGAIQLPAMAQDDWTLVQLDISACTGLDRFQKFAIVADTGITANTAVDIGGTIIAYRLSNGHGPVRGDIAEYIVSTGTVTRGQVACWPEIGNDTNGVETCDANDYLPVGIALTTSTSVVLLQTSGVAIMEAGNAIADNADVDVLSGAVTIDDAGGIQDSIGFAIEAAADANDMIYIRLQF